MFNTDTLHVYLHRETFIIHRCQWNILTFVFLWEYSDSNRSLSPMRGMNQPQDSSNDEDEGFTMKINITALDTDPGCVGSVAGKNALKSSMSDFCRSLNTDLSTSIQIESERTSYLESLRSLCVENAADDYLERKFVHDLLKTQCRDSDLFQASCCWGIL